MDELTFVVDKSYVILHWSGEAQHVEWGKIKTPTDEVVVPYDSLAPTPEGDFHDYGVRFTNLVAISATV